MVNSSLLPRALAPLSVESKLDDSLLCWKYTTPDRPTDQFRIVMSDSDHRYTWVDVTYPSTYCALRDDGTVLCHGNADDRSTTSIKRATPGTAVIEHISLGYNPSYPRRCGLTSEGRISVGPTSRTNR